MVGIIVCFKGEPSSSDKTKCVIISIQNNNNNASRIIIGFTETQSAIISALVV